MRVGAIALAAGFTSLLASASARGDDLSYPEVARLRRGDTVARTQTLVRGSRHYVGGVTYTVVDADERDVSALLQEVDVWRRILPRTRDARMIGGIGSDALIEVTHGSALVQVTYTMRLRRDAHGVRFWMDPSRPHDIEDVWGFFRSEPLEGHRALVTYGILIDMGPGLLRDLFEDRVRESALTVPDRVRDLLVERRAARSMESLVAGAGVRY
jgi:hypothetical protein